MGHAPGLDRVQSRPRRWLRLFRAPARCGHAPPLVEDRAAGETSPDQAVIERFLALGDGWAWVVDNNPTSFACCHRHAWRWLARLDSLPRPGGRLVTHRRGVAWRGNGFGIGHAEFAAFATFVGRRWERHPDGVRTVHRRATGRETRRPPGA